MHSLLGRNPYDYNIYVLPPQWRHSPDVKNKAKLNCAQIALGTNPIQIRETIKNISEEHCGHNGDDGINKECEHLIQNNFISPTMCIYYDKTLEDILRTHFWIPKSMATTKPHEEAIEDDE
jgi:hypothetical protein